MYNLFLLIFISFSYCLSQKDITWENLADVKIVQETDKKTGQILISPTFGKSVKELAGKDVYISGYLIPMNLDKKEYALSQNPFYSCFFCGKSGAESVITLNFKNTPANIKIDDFRIVRGKLLLNEDDPTKLIFSLIDAELEII